VKRDLLHNSNKENLQQLLKVALSQEP